MRMAKEVSPLACSVQTTAPFVGRATSTSSGARRGEAIPHGKKLGVALWCLATALPAPRLGARFGGAADDGDPVREHRRGKADRCLRPIAQADASEFADALVEVAGRDAQRTCGLVDGD